MCDRGRSLLSMVERQLSAEAPGWGRGLLSTGLCVCLGVQGGRGGEVQVGGTSAERRGRAGEDRGRPRR